MAVEMADYGKEKSLEFFRLGIEEFARAGFRLGDGKFELFCKRAPTADKFDAEKEMFFGDEYHTGDSSRIWSPGEVPDGLQPIQYSKQFVREWLKKKGYDPEGGGTPPILVDDVVNEVREKYRIPFEALTGLNFAKLIGETID